MTKRLLFLFWGLFLYGLGIVMTVRCNLGTGAWDVFHLGLTHYLPLTFGQISQLTGVVVILLSFFLSVKPGWATFANMYFIGFFIDLFMGNDWIPTPVYWPFQLLLLLLGIWVMGWATYFYLSAALGAGPRDSFMVGLIDKTHWPLWVVRTVLETSVAVIGYFLGGPIGIGTVIAAVTLGPSIQWAFSIMGKRAEDIQHTGLWPKNWEIASERVSK